MKGLAQVEDDLQPVYRLAQGVNQAGLVKVIKTAFDQRLDLLMRKISPVLVRQIQTHAHSQAVRAIPFSPGFGRMQTGPSSDEV